MSNTTAFSRLERCPVHWFADGDIVIKARTTNGVICCYKVHLDILAIHAPVFLEFLVDLLARDHDFVGGTPAVFVPEDAVNMGWFLTGLYHPSSLLRSKYKKTSFKNTLPLYKMALKYKVDQITNVLTAQLEQDWPKTIWEWDAFESDDELFIKGERGMYVDMYAEPVAAIAFAWAAKLPSILPAAFYQLSRVKTKLDFDDIAKLTDKFEHRTARWTELSKEDFMRLLAGKERLDDFFRCIQVYLTKSIPEEHSKCLEVWKMMPATKSKDVLRDLQDMCRPDKLPGSLMCASCRSNVDGVARKLRELVWSNLPEFFRFSETGSAFGVYWNW